MKTRKMPQRQCVGCREMRDKQALLRIAVNASGMLFADNSGRAPGRGAYLCRNEECLAKAKKSRALDRAFEMKVPEEAYEILRNEMMTE